MTVTKPIDTLENSAYGALQAVNFIGNGIRVHDDAREDAHISTKPVIVIIILRITYRRRCH